MSTIKTIIGVYRTIVYDDGSIEVERMDSSYIFTPLDGLPEIYASPPPIKVSSRVEQIVAVIAYVKDQIHSQELPIYQPSLYNDLLTEAVSQVADYYSITKNTVYDKLGRQLGLTTQSFKSLLMSFFTDLSSGKEPDKTDLYLTIYNNLSNKDKKFFNAYLQIKLDL